MVFYYLIIKVIVIYKLDVPGLSTKLSKNLLDECDKDYLSWIPHC